MPKLRIKRVQIFEFDLKPKWYEDGTTPGDMLKTEMQEAKENPEFFMMLEDSPSLKKELVTGELLDEETEKVRKELGLE